MKIKVEFETEVDSLSQAIDRLNLFREELLVEFQSAHEELTGEQDEDNFAGTWSCNRFELELELD